MVGLWKLSGLVNHMAKEYAFSPMDKKPAENMPFGDVIMSCGLSTEREEPFLSVNDDEDWRDKANARRNSVNEKSIMLFMQYCKLFFSVDI